MQVLTAAPREHLTEAQVRALLTGGNLTIKPGCELLSPTNAFVTDISEDLDEGGSIEFDNRNPVRATCRLNIQRELGWGAVRARPYMTLSARGISARFNLGVYILTRPVEERGKSITTYAVTGYDLLSRLEATTPADTYVVAAGGTYFDAAQAVMAASGIGAELKLDSTAIDTIIPATRVWALMQPAPSWLRILTDLLKEIGYVTPWPDPDGNIRSGPFQDPAVRTPEWTVDPESADHIVYGNRTVTIETGDGFNAWKFISASATVQPTIGNGLIYVPPPNDIEGPNSILALGYTKTRVAYLQVADAAELAAEGDKQVVADKAAVRTISLSIDPLPIMWADDVFTYTDRGVSEKIAATSWQLDLDGGPGRLQLGGAPAIEAEPVAQQGKATVTDDAPLTVVMDGASTPCFANALNAASYLVGDPVNVTIRNPQPPLVMGVES